MKILIGHDGSPCADAALNDLRRAGLPEVAEAIVLSAANIWPYLRETTILESQDWVLPPEAAPQALIQSEFRRARDVAARAAKRLGESFIKWKITPVGDVAPAQWAIVKSADEWHPDLVVIGSHGRSGFSRMILGSISSSVMTHLHCSVRISRHSPNPERKAVRILLAVDGSPGSAAAVNTVLARRWPAGSEVCVMTVIDSAISTAIPADGLCAPEHSIRYESVNDWVTELVMRVAKKLQGAGLSSVPIVYRGDAKRQIVDEASRWDADCIFLGAKGLTRLQRFLLGSVSTAVASRAHCSVEIVRDYDVNKDN
ncbi:MAG TPA: universal stress protein [Tepidisphaeraceae bacterium]|nr:universal stress protein [Tepidisphaeraceae bacterium]